MIGAAVNTHRSALVGVMSSLIISLIASATGCSTPYGPTRIGPRRDCAQADHLALEQHHVGDADQRRVEDDDDLQERNDERVDHQRSTSPSTMSIEPIS